MCNAVTMHVVLNRHFWTITDSILGLLQSGWESNIIPSHILVTSLQLKRCIADFPLRVGFICASRMHQIFMYVSMKHILSSALKFSNTALQMQ